jgi:hypothetical protein
MALGRVLYTGPDKRASRHLRITDGKPRDAEQTHSRSEFLQDSELRGGSTEGSEAEDLHIMVKFFNRGNALT